jgi:hypothetical protein
VENGVAILQYADDTVLCVEHDPEKALNLKLLLYMFELMSGLKINYQKSESLCVGGDDNILMTYADIFNSQIGHFPMKYLGVPVSYSSLRGVDWDFLEAKYVKRSDSGLGSNASSGGRLTLLNANISSIAYSYMCMFLLFKTILDRLDKHRRRFFWQVSKNRK